MSVTSVRLQPEIEAGLEAMAEQTQRSKGWLINQALKEFIARQEVEQTRWRQTLQAIESVAKGQAVAGQTVHAWMESWGTEDELVPPRAGQ